MFCFHCPKQTINSCQIWSHVHRRVHSADSFSDTHKTPYKGMLKETENAKWGQIGKREEIWMSMKNYQLKGKKLSDVYPGDVDAMITHRDLLFSQFLSFSSLLVRILLHCCTPQSSLTLLWIGHNTTYNLRYTLLMKQSNFGAIS